MDVQQVLKFADELVFTKTGKHLDNLQESILRGAWQGQRYSQIAENANCSEGHVKDAGSELWKLLSEVLGEDIRKSNVRATLKRTRFSIISSNFAKDFAQINNLNICGDTPHSSNVPQSQPPNEETPTPSQRRRDLREAPDLLPFYGREEELATLERWMVTDRPRLVVLHGFSGIGKTALAVQLLQEIQDDFDSVVWRSLRFSPSVEMLETNLLEFLCRPQQMDLPVDVSDRRAILFDQLRKNRCLIVLDDVQSILSNQQLAGNYQPGYEGYSLFFKQIAELSHQSCVLLITWEPPHELSALNGDRTPIRSFHLQGLGPAAAQIFRDKGLVDEDCFSKAIAYFRGNPLWLKIFAAMIDELFNGRISEAFQYEPLFLGEDLNAVLQQQCDRLSAIEKIALSALANQAGSVSVSDLLAAGTLSPENLLNALQSLKRRSFIQQEQSLFSLLPVLRQYGKTL
ncbi:AAA family ATPase [Laspinema olomoucense]|uniref:AAA family ATPase n=1 Tax=Laspinema olomoucense TaxID=3231600 RepID=UPI0021BA813F|nr:AAA family ATPase [Laspinema sp. D3c]MCT7997226.1 AAA family ATPase [Laspinema sp. D3c]